MFNNEILSIGNLGNYNFEKTKRNVNNYFMDLEKLKWEWAKLNAQKGLTANYDFEVEYQNQPYSPIGKDDFNISAKEDKEQQLIKNISSCYWAYSVLNDKERIYIEECFVNRKYESEIINLLGFNSNDSREFRNLKKSAIYKFADFLGLVVEIIKKGKK